VKRLRALLTESRSEGVYAVQENIAYVPEDVPGERIHTVERPGDLTRLAVYDLSP